MATIVREVERKYEAPDHPRLPDLTGVDGVATVADQGIATLDAVYYDTADLRLAASGVTLRRRTGGSDAGWHLKLPSGPDARDEIRLPPRASKAVPGKLAALVRARTRDAELVPVVRMRSDRHLYHLLDGKGRILAELSCDEVTAEVLDAELAVSVPPASAHPASWTEIEIELAEAGRPELFDATEERLRAAGLNRSRVPSKLARALGPRLPERAVPERGKPRTAGQAVLAYLAEQVSALIAVDPAVRRDEADSVHRMRVACRRMRSALSTFRTVLDREATSQVTEELRWLGGELSADRDREVLTERLQAMADALPRELVLGPVRSRLRIWSATRRPSTRRRVLDALNGRRYVELLNALDALLAQPPLRPEAAQPAPEALSSAVLRDYRRLAKRVAAARTDAERHECRKAAKRARYAAEAAIPVLGKAAKRFAERMKAVQDVLGEAQDGVVAREALRELAVQAHLSVENAFTYGLLYERETQHSVHAAELFDGVWREASRKKHRRALRV